MPRSAALVLAQKNYMQRIRAAKEGNPVYEKIKQYNREAFKRRYTEDEDFRAAKNEYSRLRAYYNDHENGTLRALRHLFGEYQFYGR